MPKRHDIKSILVIGAGPIIIGQGCEFDYSGAQACKALKEEGYRVILVNSNPATIMTDPELCDATYIEPIHWELVAEIIKKERPDALLPTMGGQTALNCALDLDKHGILDQFQVQMIGATREAIDKAENRALFREAMFNIGLSMPHSVRVSSLTDAKKALASIGLPAVIRSSFTLGGTGSGIAFDEESFDALCQQCLKHSSIHEISVEQSIVGWKEFEMEVVRDKHDNCIIVCSIENVDPMGVHTGDSITVAPAQTLTDKEYQRMRTMAIAVLREIGVETGGSNVQFAVNPSDGEIHVIEMNPRVSRSSALASKATGFPIARVAAKLAVGYTLDELSNEITGSNIPASFEPTLDYVVVKIPRFDFEKFPKGNAVLTTQMKSVGEVMAIGRTFQESLQKAIRSLEVGLDGFDDLPSYETLSTPSWDRFLKIGQAFRRGVSIQSVHAQTGIDLWFLEQIDHLIKTEAHVIEQGKKCLEYDALYQLKRQGFSDSRLATLLNLKEEDIRKVRHDLDLHPVYKRVDSVAGEFQALTAYMYSTYEESCESNPTERPKVMILGGGPNRIGQGIEFDYCCVHASMALKKAGFETIMVNCNPETVSTDFDTSDRLYFEPLTLEDVLEIVRIEKPIGVIVQFGGQTPLKLSRALAEAGVPILGTSVDAIDRAEDRARFKQVLEKLKLKQAPSETVRTLEESLEAARRLGFPLVVRPSYVLGGRAMEIVYHESELCDYMQTALSLANKGPILLEHFLDDAIEVDVDAVCDGVHVVIGGILEHVEQAGVHSGDSSCSLPPFSLSEVIQERLRNKTIQLALELGVVGLLNVQFAIKHDTIYVLEVNPRAARTVPFVSKAIGQSLVKIATQCMLGKTLSEIGFTHASKQPFYSVKQSVFPFEKFPGADTALSPEMRSTGEVMGVGATFAEAFAKSNLATGLELGLGKEVFLSVRDLDKPGLIPLAKQLTEYGFDLVGTEGTSKKLNASGIVCKCIYNNNQDLTHVVDRIKSGKISFLINTTEGRQSSAEHYIIRQSAAQQKVNCVTTLAGAKATVLAMAHRQKRSVFSLQDLHQR